MVDFGDRSEVVVAAKELSAFLTNDKLLRALQANSRVAHRIFDISPTWCPDPSQPDTHARFAISPSLGICVKVESPSFDGGISPAFESLTPRSVTRAIRSGITIGDIKQLTEELARALLQRAA